MRAQYDLFPYIPEDFPLLQLSQEGLDRLLAQVADCAPQLAEANDALLEDLYPLAGMQAGLLFHSQASGLYVEQLNFGMDGALQLPALIESWEQMLAAHPILRTSFVGQEALAQAVWQRVPLPLTVMDLTALGQEEQEQQVRAYRQADARRGFDIQQAPLLRLSVFRLGAEHHQFLWSFHHAILDGWSVPLLLQEFFARYQALAQGRQPQLPASRPYRDYIAWLHQQDQAEAEAFWRQQLAGLTTPTPLPLKTNHKTTWGLAQFEVEPSYGQQDLVLSKEVSQGLQRVARALQITVNTLLQASWAYVLSRYSGQDEVLFGMVVAGREAELVGVESLVGLCINTIPVRIALPAQEPVEVWLRRLHEQLATLQRYSYYPLWQIQGLSGLGPSQPLFQSILAFENYPIEQTLQQVQHSDLRLRFMDEEMPQRTNYPLSAVALPGEQIGLLLSYQEQALEAELIGRMLDLWQQVLQTLAQQPDQPLGALPLVTAAERALLERWNATQQAYPQDACVHELFEQQAQRQPDTLALVQGEACLTYGQLDRRANQLAHSLRQLGVGPDVLVGLCVERSLEMVVGLLGILKAGGAYVPLDPAHPKERLAFMLQDAHPQLLLTQQHLLSQLPDAAQPIVCLDSDWEKIARESEQQLVSGVSGTTGENLAYVIYTSGSTGKPKGTMILHRGLLNYLSWCSQAYEAGAGMGSPVHSPLGFDLTVTSLFSPLLAGQCVTLLPEEQGAEGLASALRTGADFSLVKLTPAHVQLLNQTLLPQEAATSTRALVIGGEALLAEQLAFWRQHAPATRLINEYGPTETVVGCCVYEVAPQDPASGAVPIGRPIANTQLYVLDAQLQLAPIGVPGELYIGGDGLARGYLNRPELTAERFIAHPFSQEPGARLYKTGDLARYRADGVLEFLGRSDHQVKVRGYRIELGEIEQALLEHPAVREGIVVVREDGPDNKQLVAYIVAAQDQEPVKEWQATLRAYLRERLPDYMVPTHIVLLDALPLTANGKVDRRALPDPHLRAEQGLHHPQGPIEELLAGIWQELLHVPAVSSQDHFFALGGHSLLAMQVVTRLRQQMGLELPLRTLFEAPTLAALSRRVQQQLRAEPQELLPPLQPAARSTPPPLSFAQERLWFLEQLEPGQPTYHVPLILRLHGRLNPAALEESWHLLEARHEGLRLHIAVHQGQALQGLLPVGSSPLLHLDLSGLSLEERERELRRLARQEIHRPFDLVTGPLWRTRLLRLDVENWVLLLTMHHIITDGWSMQVLLQELTQAYQAQQQGRTLSLPALPIQYADYALWQRQWLQGERLEAQLAYWRERLAGLEPLQLPTDHPRPSVQSSRGAQEVLHLSASLQQQLQALSREEGVTLFMTLLAGWLLVLQRYSGQSDLAVGTPIANRSQAELEGLIGFFVNTLVLRCQLEEQASVRELLAHVREVTLGAYSHQEVPFERVVEALQPEREMNRTPLFQVMFAGQQEVLPQQSWEGITLQGEESELELGIAKFDLTLEVAESERGIEAALEYNSDLFEPATVQRMLAHWQQALQALVQQPDQPLATLPLLTEAERALLERWNATERAYPREMCVHELFEQQAQRQPDAIALVQGEACLSYGELDRRANQLAHSLKQLGVGPDVLVGLCVERSLEMVVGLLGILKAGGAYVPLDPAYPPARLAFMLQDAQVAVLLTQEASVQGLPAHQLPLLALDHDWKAISQQSAEPLYSGTSAENLAYVMYTSGSTGQPKGVEICHRSITRLLFGVEYARLDGSRTLLHMAPISFDASTFELWGALLHGARCILLPERLPTASRIGSLIQQQQVTTTWLTASLFNAILDEAPESLRGLEQLLTGGEALSVGHIRRALQELPGTQLINGYGPTESTTFTCCQPIERELSPSTRSIPIGHPISNTQVYLLDGHLQPVPVGVAGELYIGGDGLARGYLNRPELTAERFVPHPFSEEPGARLYKTGDLARYLPDGRVEFLGRLDHQVKVRGYRIELGEIEQALLHHRAVAECVVIARDDPASSKQLVAYVVQDQDQEAAGGGQAGLRSFLRERLPEYMVPPHIMVLDALPLSANGKVDRQALLAHRPEESEQQPHEREQPRDQIELQLLRIWERVLERGPISLTDNFFSLGGHSLATLRLHAQIQNEFQRQLPLGLLFQYPTIRELAQILRQEIGYVRGSALVPLQAHGSRAPFFCVHPAGGSVFCYLDLVRHLGMDYPVYGLQVPEVEGEQAMASVEQLAAHYIAALQTVQPEGPYLLGGWSAGGIIAYEMACQLRYQGHEVALLCLFDSFRFIPSDQPTQEYKQDSMLSESLVALLNVDEQEISCLTEEEQLRAAYDALKRELILPDGLDLAYVQRFIHLQAAIIRAVRAYEPPCSDLRITLIRVEREGESVAETVKDGREPARDSTNGWSAVTTACIDVHTVPGTHNEMFREPYVQTVASTLQAYLDEQGKVLAHQLSTAPFSGEAGSTNGF